MPRLTLLVTALISVQTVLAHFQLTYPASRGFEETIEATFPCGGFNTIQNRTQVPLENAFVEINSEHTSYTYTVSVLVNNNPLIADFSTSNLTQVASGSRNYPQSACLSLDLSNNTSVVNNVNATIQVVFNGGDGLLYQCTDVTFVESAPSFNSSMCINDDGSSAPTPSATTSGSSASATQSKASSITVVSRLMVIAAICTSLIIS